MRKLELAFIIILVACATAWWTHPKEPAPPSILVTPTQNMKTRSGRYEIHSPPYRIAGIPIGCTEMGVRELLGKPTLEREDERAKEAHHWDYESDGQKLTVSFMEDRVISIGGTGRWGFEEQGKPGMTLFMQSRETISTRLGAPKRNDGVAEVYDAHPGELTIRFGPNGKVEQFWLVGELKHL